MVDDTPEQAPLIPAKPSDAYPTKLLWRLLSYFNKNIRETPKDETAGVIRNIQRLIDKGIGYDLIAAALENYANDSWVKAQDPRNRRKMRAFFTEESIKEWQTPRPPLRKPLPVLTLETSVKPQPYQPRLNHEPDDL